MALVLYKSIFNSYDDGSIALTIMQNKVNVHNVDQERVVQHKNDFYVDKLDFTSDKTSLSHAKLGNIGYNKNFFIDFNTKIVLKKDLKLDVVIYSDDGFNLIVDNRNVMSFKTNRPLSANKIEMNLQKGSYAFKLEYYQGVGHLGVKGEYVIDGKTYLIGEDSEFVKFVNEAI